MAVLVVVSVFDNCCKRLLLDWTLWETDNKWKIEEFFHEVSRVYINKWPRECIEMLAPK